MSDQAKIIIQADIKLLVDSFYTKVREDDLLADIFNNKIQDRWQEHLDKMYRFWQTVLLEEHTYHGRPFGPHARLPIEQEHFDRWLILFYETLDEKFTGEKYLKQNGGRRKWLRYFIIKLNITKTIPVS